MSLPQQVAELKQFRYLFEIGQAKVEIVRAANVVIEEVQGTVTITPAADAIFQIEPTEAAIFNVRAEAGYFYVRTEVGQQLNINIARIEEGVVFNVAQSGSWTVNAVQSGDWTIYAQQTGEWNVYIQTKSDIEIRITVVNASIALPIDIQATTIALAIDIQATTIALPVDIQAQTINLKIDIAAQSVGNLAVDIAAQTVGNIAVDIAAQSVGNIAINIARIEDGVIFNVAQSGEWTINAVQSGSWTVNIQNTAETAIYIKTESGVAINVQTEGTVTLNIWTPSGKIVSAAGTISNTYYKYLSILSGSSGSTDVISVTKPSKCTVIGFMVSATTSVDVMDDVTIEVYVDGSTSPFVSLTIRKVDLLNGGIATQMFEAGSLNDGTNILNVVSPKGGLTAVTYSTTNNKIWKAGGFMAFDINFDSSIKIEVVNNTTVTLGAYLEVVYGWYR